MKTTTSSSAHLTNGQESIEHATNSNMKANKARFHLNKRNFYSEIVFDWIAIMTKEPVILFCILFPIFYLAETVVSWDPIKELLRTVFEDPPVPLILLMSFFLLSITAVVSHLLSKKLRRPLFNWEVANTEKFSETPIPKSRAIAEVEMETKRDFILGIIGLIVLLILVGSIAWQRVFIMSELQGEDFPLYSKVLTLIFAFCEVFTGIYLVYFYKLIIYKRKISKHHKKYTNNKNYCSYETHRAVEHWNFAKKSGEEIPNNKQLHDAIYRFENRSSDSDNYVDEIPEAKVFKKVDKPVQDVHILGKIEKEIEANSN